MPSRKQREVPQAAPQIDKFKMEVAEELGLADKVRSVGWENMTSRECGQVGGHMVKRMIEFAEGQMKASNGNIPSQATDVPEVLQ